MIRINSAVLRQFSEKGLVINEGVAVDARLVQSASHPISSEEIEKEQAKRETPAGKLDKNWKPLKFSRDIESDWTIKNKKLSRKRYIVEQYFGVSHLHYGAFRARFPRMIKNALDNLFRQMAFNLFRGNQILGTVKI